jgi:hypothetical protein
MVEFKIRIKIKRIKVLSKIKVHLVAKNANSPIGFLIGAYKFVILFMVSHIFNLQVLIETD